MTLLRVASSFGIVVTNRILYDLQELAARRIELNGAHDTAGPGKGSLMEFRGIA
jgi:hypothetical protein